MVGCPYEIKEWLRQKTLICNSGNPLVSLNEALTTATWALGREVDQTGTAVHWTSRRALILIRPSAVRINLRVRSPVASRETPTTVLLRPDAGTARLVLNDTRWQTQTVRFRNSIWHRLSGMHSLEIEVSPVFIPDERFHNSDRRVLGVLMRVPEIW